MARKKKQYGAGSLFRKTRTLPDGTVVEAPTWYIQYSVDGKVYRESTKTSVYNEAQQKLKARWAELQNGTHQTSEGRKTTMGEVLDDLLEYYRVQRPRSYQRFAKPIITQHLKPYFEHMRASGVTTTQIKGYIAEREAAGSKNAVATINRELSLLRRAFHLAKACTPPKVQTIPSFSGLLRQEDNARQGFWEHDQYEAFKRALPRDEADLLTYAYFTGCRLGEILKLTWNYVDLEHAAIRLPRLDPKTGLHMKGKKPRIIPLGGPAHPLYDMLVSRWALRAELCPDSEWVFFRSENRGNRGKIGEPMVNIRRMWNKAVAATGINLLRHDLRRTGVRNLIRAGVPQRVAMAISGHRTSSVFDRYNIVDEKDLQDAATKLAAYVAKKPA